MLKNKKFLEAVVFCFVVMSCLILRLEDIRHWNVNSERAFFQNEPLLTNFDGYFYLTLARDLTENTYTRVDMTRGVPSGTVRPSPPPLLSVVASLLTQYTPFSLQWIAVLLPSFLGILLAFPLYFLGRFYGGFAMGITAVVTGMLSGYYMQRTGIGWFDTDCMNVTFTLMIIYSFLRFGVETGVKRYLFLGMGVVTYILFLLWWDQARKIVTVLSLFPFMVAFVFFYRPPFREWLYFSLFLVFCLTSVLAYIGMEVPGQIFNSVIAHFNYASKSETGDFPNVGIMVMEQAGISFSDLVHLTTANSIVLVLSFVGIIWLFITKKKESLFLLVLLLLSLLAIFFAKRFVIFLAPLSALGLGWLVSEIWNMKKRWKGASYVAGCILVFSTVTAGSAALTTVYWPQISPQSIAGMEIAGEKTPENSVVWAWWDVGYALHYWSERAIITDGSIHNGQVTVYNAFPLTVESFRLSANFMQFYVARGVAGMNRVNRAVGGDGATGFSLVKAILEAGPEKGRTLLVSTTLIPQEGLKTVDDWLQFFFPPNPDPLYLLLDFRLFLTGHWWYRLGTWDQNKQDGDSLLFQPYFNMSIENYHATNPQGLNVDFKKGKTRVFGKDVLIRDVYLRGEGSNVQKHHLHDRGINFEIFFPGKFGVLTDPIRSETVFNKLFIRHFGPEIPYFRPVALNAPAYQLWVVRGDQLSGRVSLEE